VTKLALSLALGDYEHTRDLVNGDVSAEGIDLAAVRVPIEELLFRFHTHREWQAAEFGLGTHTALISRGNDELVGIPVFTSRTFRHAALYLRRDAGIEAPADLAGRRVGVPQWSMTAVTYARALLQHSYGVDLRSIRWFQAGVNEPGRVDSVKHPEGFSISPEPERSLSEMLLAGDLDAVISARAPAPFEQGDPRICRAWKDLQAEELLYWKAQRIFPIMHMIVIRRDFYERNRWVAMNLFKAFEAAKRRSLARMRDVTVSHLPLPWLPNHVAMAEAEMGEDFWPYGIEPNRRTLDAFCQYAFEQGGCARRLQPEELFAPETLSEARV
jgi:4,5-dihydroxyphthalate decarboxylase